LGPVIFLDNFISVGLVGVAVLVAWVFSFGLLAYANLDEVWALQAVKRIVELKANKSIPPNAISAD
jgi:hypothetical protein